MSVIKALTQETKLIRGSELRFENEKQKDSSSFLVDALSGN